MSKRLELSVKGLPKLGLYFSLLVQPGGFVGLLLVWWLERRRAAGSNGTTWMRYVQVKGWRDLGPALWRMMSQAPAVSIGSAGDVRRNAAMDLAGKYIRA